MRSAEEAAVEAVEASAEAAAESAKDAAGPIIAHIVSRDPTGRHTYIAQSMGASSNEMHELIFPFCCLT